MSSRMARGIRRSDRKPHFFKVLLGDFKHQLKIPPKFMKHIGKQAAQKVTIQGPNRSTWQVELRETTNGDFLSAGWSQFVKDNSLKEYEFLVFRYDGNMHFTVMIFDTSACEREDIFETMTPRISACEGTNKKDCPLKHSSNTNHNFQNQSSRRKTLKVISNNKHVSKQMHGLPASLESTSNATSKSKEMERPSRKPKKYTFYSSCRRPVTTEERAKAEKAANSFSSPFPYTIICMTASYVYKILMLKFPPCFARMHLPHEKANMVLRDPSGMAWNVVYIPRVKSMDRLCGGWSAFARGNCLEEGDFCAFELIGELELRVHIFRVVEETTPLAKLSRERPQRRPKRV